MIIDTENLSTLSLPELAALLLLYDKRVEKSETVVEIRDIDIERMFQNLEKKGFIISSIYATDRNIQPPFQHISYSLIEAGRQAIAENCSRDRKITKILNQKALRERCDALALKLQELYPVGKKAGTSLNWRDAPSVISKKLSDLIESGEEFTDEEAIEATKSYINSFNGRYETMRVLKYFISKRESKGGKYEYSCDFMSEIQNIRSNPQNVSMRKDWDVILK